MTSAADSQNKRTTKVKVALQKSANQCTATKEYGSCCTTSVVFGPRGCQNPSTFVGRGQFSVPVSVETRTGGASGYPPPPNLPAFVYQNEICSAKTPWPVPRQSLANPRCLPPNPIDGNRSTPHGQDQARVCDKFTNQPRPCLRGNKKSPRC